MADALEWTAHPARQRPRDLALVLCVLLLTMGAVLATFQSFFFALLSAAILLASISSFLFPTHYAISAWGVQQARLGQRRARPWHELRRMELGNHGALLSPFAKASWMDRYRGLVLQFGTADQAVIVELLKKHFSPPDRCL